MSVIAGSMKPSGIFPNISIYVLNDDTPHKALNTEDQWLAEAQEIKAFSGEPIMAVFCGSDYGHGEIWKKCYPEAEIIVFPREGFIMWTKSMAQGKQ